MNTIKNLSNYIFLIFCICTFTFRVHAQNDATVNAKIDARNITVGDQVKLFIEAKHNTQSSIKWANIPDSFNSLEVVEKGKIDTITQGNLIIYKQRLLITGFDSGSFKIPHFVFLVIPSSGIGYNLQTDSFQINVNTVAVDTSQSFRPIKGIMAVPASWKDYIGWITGGVLLLALIILLIRYFTKKKPEAAIIPKIPDETLQQKTLRLLKELEAEKLWQQNQIKEYYTQLTDILRGYIEERFNTPAMELTTDELLTQSHKHKEMSVHYDQLAHILNTADLAKFAKAEPLPYEHMESMEQVKQFVIITKPVIIDTNQHTK